MLRDLKPLTPDSFDFVFVPFIEALETVEMLFFVVIITDCICARRLVRRRIIIIIIIIIRIIPHFFVQTFFSFHFHKGAIGR